MVESLVEGSLHRIFGANQGMGDTELKIILSHNLGDGIRPMLE